MSDENYVEEPYIQFAEQDKVDCYQEEVEEILATIGKEEALVTDLSQFSDFTCTSQADMEIIQSLYDQLGLRVRISDYIADVAEQLRRERIRGGVRDLINAASEEHRPRNQDNSE